MNHNDPQWSYDKQRNNEQLVFKEQRLPPCYANPTSIDAWRHRRMHESLMPLLRDHPGARWLTVGDGNYGSDAHFLKENGADVLASSLTDEHLVVAKEKGFIDEYRAENAEKLSAADGAFDFVLCKESYHHFPRPPIALYEMLRVARRAVILIEPQETARKVLDYAKDIIKRLIRKDASTSFEPSGNFIFRVNIHEIEKMMIALNYEVVATRKFNDFYHPRVSSKEYAPFSMPVIITKFGIFIQNILCASKALDYGLATVMAFKEKPGRDLLRELERHGFKVSFLPKNPYLKESGQ